jgi:hypothetical protein
MKIFLADSALILAIASASVAMKPPSIHTISRESEHT